MYKFKAGDWITIKTLQDDKFQLTEKEVEYSEILLGDCRFGIEDWELLQPKESDLVPDDIDPDDYVHSVVHSNECACPDCCESSYYQWLDGEYVKE